MKYANLFRALCLGLFLLLSIPLHAQDNTLITPQNLSSFSLFRAGAPDSVACYANGSERKLGYLSSQGGRSIIMIGAVFTPLSPTVSQQEERLRKLVNSNIRALKRPSSSKAKSQARKRLKQANRELTLLTSYTNWCSTFTPASSQPGRFQPPSSRPNPGSNPGTNPGTNPDLNPGSGTDSNPENGGNNPGNGSNNGDGDGQNSQKFFVDDSGQGPTHTCSPTLVSGTVTGTGSTIVTLANDSFIESQNVSGGNFAFPYVPTGVYSLVAESDGASFGPAHKVIVRTDGDCQGISFTRQELPDSGAFAFRWQQQDTLNSGLEQWTQTASVRSSASTTLSATSPQIEPAATQASTAQALLKRFRITLNSSDLSWGAEHAERLKLALETIFPVERGESPIKKDSVWILTAEHMPNDMQITEMEERYEVRINSEAFRYAALTPVEIDGVRGHFFSERLTLAAARFLSRQGKDRGLIEQTLLERYGFLVVNDLNEVCSLTDRTTRECGESFQFFTNDELLQLLGSIAQLPPRPTNAVQLIPLLRRRNGVRHPSAALDALKIVPYSEVELASPYIEFASEAFFPAPEKVLRDPRYPSKEVLLLGVVGANASILWDRQLTRELRDAWTTEMGWTYNSFSKEWSNDNMTEVGAPLLAGVKGSGPQADFATSVAKYVSDPEELRFRSPKRFEFLKLYVMHGLRYVRQFREDLKFPVLNLRPDFSYPGKTKAIEVVVTGKPEEDKRVRITLTLEGNDPLEHGATYGYGTLRSRGGGAGIPLHLSASRPDFVYNTSLVLKMDGIVSKYLPMGFYDLESLCLIDGVGNTRFDAHKGVGFKLFLNNVLEAPEPARLIEDSVTLSMSQTILDGVTVPMFTTLFKVTKPEQLQGADATHYSIDSGRGVKALNQTVRRVGDTVRISTPVSPFLASGLYGLYGLYLRSTGVDLLHQFSLDGGMQGSGYFAMPVVEHESSQGDVTGPELDLNSLRVTAESLSPSKPNGATKVVVKMRAKDDLSGLGSLYFCLRSPIDRSICGSLDLDRKTSVLPEGTTEFKEYSSTLYLPAGSAPGTWGVDTVYGSDLVNNYTFHSLTELVKFIVDNKGV